MGKPKEDRSDWVAVAPEFSETTTDAPLIRPAQSAYQIFSRDVTPSVKEELMRGPGKFEVGLLSKAVSDRWASLDIVRKARYEDLARQDAARFAKESHQADIAALERQNRMRQERDEIILDDTGGRRSTRRNRKKQKRKQERRERKKQQRKEAGGKDGSSSDPDFNDDSGDSYHSSDDSSSYDSDDSNRPKKHKKKAPPRQLSQAVLERREHARLEREEKEKYIAERQDELRLDRATQAKRRLDFLLKQSDIFSHFGQVKEGPEPSDLP